MPRVGCLWSPISSLSFSMSMFRTYWIIGIILGVLFVHALPHNSPPKNVSPNRVLPRQSPPQTLTVFGYTLNTTTDECVVDSGFKIAQFFVFNYITHAFTLRVGAGYMGTYRIIFSLGALFLPYYGLLLACRSMESWAIGAKGALDRAGRGGALCVVARTKKWRPRRGEKAWCWRSAHGTGTTRVGHYAGLELEYLSQYYVNVHGICHLPETGEYLLARLPTDYKVDWARQVVVGQSGQSGQSAGLLTDRTPEGPQDTIEPEDSQVAIERVYQVNDTECSISSSYSAIKPLITIVQLLSAVPTIYAAHKLENQTSHGYAGYQLTVIPFALMSIINTISVISTSSYEASYMVSSTIMEEAKLRGAVFDGVVGKLCESTNKIELKVGDCELVGESGECKERAKDDVYMSFPGPEAIDVDVPKWTPDVSKNAIRKIFRFVFRQQIWEGIREEAPILRWLLSWQASKKLQASATREPETNEVGDTEIRRLNPHITCLNRLFKNLQKKTENKKPTMILFPAIGNPIPRENTHLERAMYYIADVIFVLSIMAPYLITYYLTGYKKGNSTPAQRVIVILWLVLMQVACIPQRLVWNYLQTRLVAPLTKEKSITEKAKTMKLVPKNNKMREGLAFVLVSATIYSIPGILGFVHVFILMVDDNKRNCNGALGNIATNLDNTNL